jgi:hypothetical protein
MALATAARNARAETDSIDFKELYVRGTEPTEKTLSLAGKRVTMQGFMAPPLKADADFFVLTKMPMAVCFCDTTMDWPDDIVLVPESLVFVLHRANHCRGHSESVSEQKRL